MELSIKKQNSHQKAYIFPHLFISKNVLYAYTYTVLEGVFLKKMHYSLAHYEIIGNPIQVSNVLIEYSSKKNFADFSGGLALLL